MGLDNEPAVPLALKNLGAIPTHLYFANMRNKVKCENSYIATHLYFWIDEFIVVNPYLSSKAIVIVSDYLQSIQATLQKGIKISHLWSGYF